MRTAKIGSPLFILREKCAVDLMGVLERLAEIGYDGVEFLGFFNHKPSTIRNKLEAYNLTAIGDHVSFEDFTKNAEKTIEDHKILDCGYITIGAPPADSLPGEDGYLEAKKEIERIGEMMNSAGMKLLFHNHSNELNESVNGKTILENLLDDISSDLLYLEPDLGWMSIGGAEPSYYLTKYRNRCPIIHFKYYYAAKPKRPENFEFRPTGYGVMCNASLYELSLECKPEWYIMDHDCSYERDEFNDLQLSLEYFKNLIAVHR